MAYPEDLFQFAQDIATLHPNEAHQPSLRRALSTAYYALFHLLIADAVASCADPQFKATFARMFEHGLMKNASSRKASEINTLFKENPPQGHERIVKFHLHNVAETFWQAHQNRNDADYNLYREWQPDQVSLRIEAIGDAFKSWSLIREEQAARDYLMSMLPTKENKQPEKASRQDKRPSLTDPSKP